MPRRIITTVSSLRRWLVVALTVAFVTEVSASPRTESWSRLWTQTAEHHHDGRDTRGEMPPSASVHGRTPTLPFTLHHKAQPGKPGVNRSSDGPLCGPLSIEPPAELARVALFDTPNPTSHARRRHQLATTTGPPLSHT